MLTPPSSVVVNTQGRESGGSWFETWSGVWYPRRRLCGVAINTLVDLLNWLGKPQVLNQVSSECEKREENWSVPKCAKPCELPVRLAGNQIIRDESITYNFHRQTVEIKLWCQEASPNDASAGQASAGQEPGISGFSTLHIKFAQPESRLKTHHDGH